MSSVGWRMIQDWKWVNVIFVFNNRERVKQEIDKYEFYVYLWYYYKIVKLWFLSF